FSSRRRHTRCSRDWSSDVYSSDLLKNTDRPNLRAVALRGDILAEEERDAYSPEDVLTILAYAMIEDREKIASLPHVAVRVIPNRSEERRGGNGCGAHSTEHQCRDE